MSRISDFFSDLRDRVEYMLPSSTSDLTALALFSAIVVCALIGIGA
jgi:hypothetical protein